MVEMKDVLKVRMANRRRREAGVPVSQYAPLPLMMQPTVLRMIFRSQTKEWLSTYQSSSSTRS